MVIDSSALIAIEMGETEAEAFVEAIAHAINTGERVAVPASVLLEAGLILDTRGMGTSFDQLIESLQPEVIAIDREVAEISRIAYRRFGKGLHPARLNMGDCMSYAVARQLGEELLFKGHDFTQTDIALAL